MNLVGKIIEVQKSQVHQYGFEEEAINKQEQETRWDLDCKNEPNRWGRGGGTK